MYNAGSCRRSSARIEGRKMFRKLRWWIALLAAAVFTLGCDRKTDPIRIGVACPITGTAAAFGKHIKMGAELARDQINAAGGINGRDLELRIEDDEGKDTQAATAANRLASDDSIVAVVGHYNSACSAAGREIYKQAGVLQLSPGSTNINICRLSEWTFRNLYHDGYQGVSIARYIKNVLGHDSAAVFYEDDDYGQGLRDAFVEEAGKIGLEIVDVEPYIREQTRDYTIPLNKMLEKNPGIVFIAGLYGEAATIAQQSRGKNIDIPFLGGDGLYSPELINIGEEAVEGMLLTTPFIVHPTIGGELAQDFMKAFQEKYNIDPVTWSALAYDAVNMVADAIKKVGTDRTAVRDHFASIMSPEDAFEGVTGLTYFDEHGDCPKKAYVAIVQNGAFEPAPEQLLDETEAPKEKEAE